ncbi:MAG: 1-deoxy-D-xylulose-5-phosphate reductoisomerase [Burkholderiaceae bacterium]
MRSITILGATGSIGGSTLDVVARHPDRFRVHALSAHRRIDELARLCAAHRPRFAVVPDAEAGDALRASLAAARCETVVLHGAAALDVVAADPEVDVVMAAIVGAAGLAPAIAAARAGKRILLANKEALVCAGPLFLRACQQGGASVLPIDSEHNAVFQCLTPMPSGQGMPGVPKGVSRILLTASGGPFRQRSPAEMAGVTPQQACAHPNWSMGRKISVDSATLMNKGLELIEAHFLFGIPAERLDVVVHPQSIIHSLVEYEDGSMLAQLGNPDMRVPIAHALGFPDRIASGVERLDLARIAQLQFEAPDPVRFPCLRLAFDALGAGAAAPCVLNAANEVAVDAFLHERLAFTNIATVNDLVLQALGAEPSPADIDEVFALDERARALARRHLLRYAA